jgi:zinc D-Ala-D-Ala carboxypeptidase
MKLSKNFVLSEFTRSNTAKRLGIENEPNKEDIQNIQELVTKVLQPIRSGIGSIRISSGYRSPQLSKAVGSSSRSQHCKGQAADIQYWENGKMNNKVIYDYVIDNALDFDQMINEFDFSWIHISFKSKGNRREVLEAYKDDKGRTKYKFADDIITL